MNAVIVFVYGQFYVRTCHARNGYHMGHRDVSCNYCLIDAFMLQRDGPAPGACSSGPIV